MTVVHIELPVYKVVATADPALPYVLVDEREIQVVVVADYLRELTASDCSPLTVKSYAFDLQGWFRFLLAEGVAWDAATRVQVRDYVLMLRSAETRNAAALRRTTRIPGRTREPASHAAAGGMRRPRSITGWRCCRRSTSSRSGSVRVLR